MQFIYRLRQRVLTAGIVCTRAFLSQLAFGVSAIVTDAAGRVLLVRPRFGHGWGLPGGGVGGGEVPAAAILRELHEEIGLSGAATPELFGLYTRRIAWATNLIAVYRVTGGVIAFKPNFEIVEICWIDPAAPPPGVQPGTVRRLAEFAGKVPHRPLW